MTCGVVLSAPGGHTPPLSSAAAATRARPHVAVVAVVHLVEVGHRHRHRQARPAAATKLGHQAKAPSQAAATKLGQQPGRSTTTSATPFVVAFERSFGQQALRPRHAIHSRRVAPCSAFQDSPGVIVRGRGFRRFPQPCEAAQRVSPGWPSEWWAPSAVGSSECSRCRSTGRSVVGT